MECRQEISHSSLFLSYWQHVVLRLRLCYGATCVEKNGVTEVVEIIGLKIRCMLIQRDYMLAKLSEGQHEIVEYTSPRKRYPKSANHLQAQEPVETMHQRSDGFCLPYVPQKIEIPAGP